MIVHQLELELKEKKPISDRWQCWSFLIWMLMMFMILQRIIDHIFHVKKKCYVKSLKWYEGRLEFGCLPSLLMDLWSIVLVWFTDRSLHILFCNCNSSSVSKWWFLNLILYFKNWTTSQEVKSGRCSRWWLMIVFVWLKTSCVYQFCVAQKLVHMMAILNATQLR